MGLLKWSIALKALGIEGMTPRRALTGALVLEVKGEEHCQKADALAT